MRFLAWAEQELAHRAQRDLALHVLKFPYGEFRQGQRQLAEAAYKAACTGTVLMAQAPTGIGKTLIAGAIAVIEGAGDHCCEYMTGGIVVVLGRTGRNFAAGMSGGIAYVYDEDGSFGARCNTAMVSLDKVLVAEEQRATQDAVTFHKGVADELLLRKLIEDHHKWTGSLRAREILDHWATARARFVKVFPHEYRRALTEMGAKKEASETIAKAKGDRKAAKAKA